MNGKAEEILNLRNQLAQAQIQLEGLKEVVQMQEKEQSKGNYIVEIAQDLTKFMRSQKVEHFKVGDIEVKFSPAVYLEDAQRTLDQEAGGEDYDFGDKDGMDEDILFHST